MRKQTRNPKNPGPIHEIGKYHEGGPLPLLIVLPPPRRAQGRTCMRRAVRIASGESPVNRCSTSSPPPIAAGAGTVSTNVPTGTKAASASVCTALRGRRQQLSMHLQTENSLIFEISALFRDPCFDKSASPQMSRVVTEASSFFDALDHICISERRILFSQQFQINLVHNMAP